MSELTSSNAIVVFKPSEKWMSFLPDSLPLNKLRIPGTHNSGAGENTSKSFGKVINFAAKCQSLTLKDQLLRGIRYIDIRLRIDEDQKLFIYHGVVKYSTSFFDVLETFVNFLGENNKETIFMRVHREDSDQNKNPDSLFMQLFLAEINKFHDFFYSNFENENPTIREIRGKIMIFGIQHVENSQSFSPYKFYPIYKQAEYTIISDKKGIQSKLDSVRHGMARSLEYNDNLFVNEVSSVGNVPLIPPIPLPKRMAKKMNEEIEKMLIQKEACFQGVLMFDFPEISPSGKLIEIVYSLNFE